MKIAKAAVAVALGAGVAILAYAQPSAASVAADCKTVTATMNRPDSRPGGFWADDSFSRTAKVCRVAPSQAPSAEKVEINTDQYTVEITDEGTFKTKGTVSFKGHLMQPGVTGAFQGSLGDKVSFRGVVTAPHSWIAWNGTNPGNLGADEGTSSWIVKLWADGASLGDSIWGWDYLTCNEKLTNASKGNSGDITGLNPRGYNKCISTSFIDNCDGSIVVIFTNAGGLAVYGTVSGKDGEVLVAGGQKVNVAPVNPASHEVKTFAWFKNDKDKLIPIFGTAKTHTWVKPSDCVKPSSSTSAAPPVTGNDGGNSLPVTGPPIGLIVAGGAVLLAGGFAALHIARRRRIKFTA